jgi:hypothetical protein
MERLKLGHPAKSVSDGQTINNTFGPAKIFCHVSLALLKSSIGPSAETPDVDVDPFLSYEKTKDNPPNSQRQTPAPLVY